jgi:uncharacterized protein (TIGR03435 family)
MIGKISLIASGCCFLLGQQGFEVASIKPSDPSVFRPIPLIQNTGPRFDMRGITLKVLIQLAYGVRDSQIFGGPAWVNSDRYDIVATVPESNGTGTAEPNHESKLTDGERNQNRDRMEQLLKPFLADRFQLKAHFEKRRLPVYTLTVAKNGPKLSEDTGSKGGEVPSGAMRTGRGLLMGSHIDIPFFVRVLSQVTGRTILDQTRLTGKYDLQLKWAPDQGAPNGAFGGPIPPDSPGTVAPGDSDLPTIFVALQEQLGLALRSGRAPVDVLLIDHADKPSAN